MERSWRRIAWLAAALVVCLMLVAAGCGDDDEESGGGDGGGAADQSGGDSGGPVKFEPGQEFKGVFIPKQTGVAVFEQANQGAKEAAGELQVDEAEFLGPSSRSTSWVRRAASTPSSRPRPTPRTRTPGSSLTRRQSRTPSTRT